MKTTILTTTALVATLGLSASTATAASVWIDFDGDKAPDTTVSAAPGSTITGALYSDIDDLQSWGVRVTYSGVTLDNIVFDPNWFLPETRADGVNMVDLFDGRVGGVAYPPAIHLADVVLDVTAEPIQILLGEYRPDLSNFDAIVDAAGHVWDKEAEYVPSAVPEPTSFVLIVSAAGLLGIIRRKVA